MSTFSTTGSTNQYNVDEEKDAERLEFYIPKPKKDLAIKRNDHFLTALFKRWTPIQQRLLNAFLYVDALDEDRNRVAGYIYLKTLFKRKDIHRIFDGSQRVLPTEHDFMYYKFKDDQTYLETFYNEIDEVHMDTNTNCLYLVIGDCILYPTKPELCKPKANRTYASMNGYFSIVFIDQWLHRSKAEYFDIDSVQAVNSIEIKYDQ
ncbi:hypothetical protein GJ496_002206 [Pomphorhynchus laevis]|nr:hypothetical protein GJ496_002206 [Pomphorhynchus laevis]